VFAGTLVAGLFAWAACGDDDSVITTSPDAGNEAAVDSAARDATEVLDDANSPPIDPDTGPKHQLSSRDAGPENQILDAGDVDGGVPCTADGELEVEPNDTKQTANPMNPPSTRCGYIRAFQNDGGYDAGAAGDGGWIAETDFMTFQISEAASNIYIQYHGDGVRVLVQAGDDGGVQDISQPGVTLPFKRHVPYFIQVVSKDGTPQLWRVSYFEDH
jgi:hypothetical protein